MVIGNSDGGAAVTTANVDGGGANSLAHPSGIPQDKIDNIMSGIANTGDVKMNNHRKKLRQRFDIIKKLGQGTYGKVQLGINKETGQEVAIKTIKKCKIEAEADLVRIRREVQIMSSVQHPNIIHIYEVFENREKMVLVMEFAAGGELYDYLSERKVLSEEEARRIFRQVATAVYYCHKHKICHRDLKLENILLDEQGNAKIADFGLSNVFDDQRLLATFCGSPLYASPEIVEGTPYQGPEVDCWSLGVLLYTLVYGSMPFDGSNFKRLVKQISQGDYYEPKKPSRASSLIREMLTVSPTKRATIEQICSHWWVNENDKVSCLDLAEDLANQTPVRLDVLLSLTPTAVTADQLVVPSADGNAANKGNDRVPRSHSVGSIRDIPTTVNTEAEQRILDMVAAGGEAALMPSPTRTITPAQSPVQTKRKLETTVSMENAAGAVKKKEKPGSSFVISESTGPLSEETPMETEDVLIEEPVTPAVKHAASGSFSQKDMQIVGDLCEQLIQDNESAPSAVPTIPEEVSENTPSTIEPTTQAVSDKANVVEATSETKDPTKVIKKFVNKHKTTDLINAIGQANPEKTGEQTTVNTPTSSASKTSTVNTIPPFVRKCSLQDESQLNKFNTERRKSRILETAEKFQQMNAGNASDKPKKLVIPGVSVGSYKKEFERKATPSTAPPSGPTPGERRAQELVAAANAAAQECENTVVELTPPNDVAETKVTGGGDSVIESSDSKNSVSSFSLEDARRSMENSIALLRQAQNESAKDVDQLCAQTENIEVNETSDPFVDRERKLRNARTIIGNAIQPAIRRPPTSPFVGIGGGGYGNAMRRASTSGGFMSSTNYDYDYDGDGDDDRENQNTFSGYNYYHPTIRGPISPPIKLSAYNKFPNDALAAARQKIGRFVAGGHSLFHQNSTSPASLLNSNYNYNAMGSRQQNQHQNQNVNRNFYQNQLSSNQPEHQLQHRMFNQQQQERHQTQKYNQLNHVQEKPIKHSYTAYNTTTNANAYANINPNVNMSANATAANAANANLNNVPKPFYNALPSPPTFLKSSPGGDQNSGTVKTSTASITLKSATLPRRKTAKTEIQLDIKPTIVEKPTMRFTTEMQHPIPDLRSAPPREGPMPYSPIKTSLNARASSLEPKEHIIPIQRPQSVYTRTSSNTTNRSDSLSRQSTIDSESDTTTTPTNVSQSTVTGSSQPIKKSPREFIIPIAVEGGGFITPREGSIEPSESSHTTTSSRSTFNRLRPTRRIGSLLSDSGVEDSSPFQKIRTSSINREGDDDRRFTLHRLRSSRPMKTATQDNDSQSSGEEDDDDGFEIVTAENLFSTLLQRVRALTNSLNVNNDMRGFPSSSRLLGNIRPGNSAFWNQEPFGRSQVSYSYSQTVEKKQVRLNSAGGNSIGAPWRHSMSRDLNNDMESLFSRTGATLPRGHKSSGDNKIVSDNVDCNINPLEDAFPESPLDLADLDLSRLRLSKKDLETLSTITPGLPKCFQEQLLAKLPPTQARKLSRTLSMQHNPQTPTVKVYKRSQSGGRNTIQEGAIRKPLTKSNDLIKEYENEELELTSKTSHPIIDKTNDETLKKSTTSDKLNDSNETTAQIHRYSTSRSQCDFESSIPLRTVSASKSRSTSVCRDDYTKSLYAPEVSEKYKYYSPYLSKSCKEPSRELSSISPQKRYGSVSPRGSITSAAIASGRPPSGCLSPPITAIEATGGTSSLRRRSNQRRISRFLRPDFFDEQALEENPYQREKNIRERETQSVLREIREKSRETSRERFSNFDCDQIPNRKRSLPNEELNTCRSPSTHQHARNKSLDIYSEKNSNENSQENSKDYHKSMSRQDFKNELNKSEWADKILQELQILSKIRSNEEKCASMSRNDCTPKENLQTIKKVNSNVKDDLDEKPMEKSSTIKKVKKVKPKEKLSDNIIEGEPKLTTTVVKKVKKIVKKSDNPKTPNTEVTPNIYSPDTETPSPIMDQEATKKESKLKRPKSFPTKEGIPITSKTDLQYKVPTSKLSGKHSAIAEDASEQTNLGSVPSSNNGLRESRLMRPKSYPASKLTPPKDLRKVTRNDASIVDTRNTECQKSASVSRQSTSEEKSLSATPTGKSNTDNSSSSESKPTTVKKIVKVTKKSKLVQPTVISPTLLPDDYSRIPTSTDSTTPSKEKSPEKKLNKGLFYAIGQKFEKLRDSAMNKEKKTGSGIRLSPTKTIHRKDGSPEKIKEKTSLLKKKKSLENSTSKTDQSPIIINNITTKIPKLPSDGNDENKPAKTEKRSRFDAMLRSLRERSVPRTQLPKDKYIKRAASVEEFPSELNKKSVNRVFGFFKRSEKDDQNRHVQGTRSTSNIERQLSDSSPIYQNTIDELVLLNGTNKSNSSSFLNQINNSVVEDECHCNIQASCPECNENQIISKRRDVSKFTNNPQNSKEIQNHGNKDKRKGLMLELLNIDPLGNAKSTTNRSKKTSQVNGNILYSNLPPYPGAIKSNLNSSSTSQQSVDNNTSNNNNSSLNNNNSSLPTSQTSGYHTSSAHEINRNHLQSPSTENFGNYSSDSRSYQDDCASTSTFLSPTDEPELYFDNWSVCSEENYMLHATPSPTVSRLSRVSQMSSPTRCESSDPNESVIDRIKRRSFYSRFNEKKPKRTSSIVGPSAVRDYYREQQSAIKTRSSNKLNANERPTSPDITQEFFRPLKLSPVGTELKPPIYKSPMEYTSSLLRPRKSLNDIRPIISPSSTSYLSKRYGSTSTADNDYLSTSTALPSRYKSSTSSSPYENNSCAATSNYYSTYNPKRRSSYTLNGTLPSGSGIKSSNLDGYATVGRRTIRPYDQRTVSLLEPTSIRGANYRRETRTPVRDYTSSISRSNSHYRTSSANRSPTNI